MDLLRNKYFWITLLLILFILVLIFSLKSNSKSNPSSSKYSCNNGLCVEDPNGNYSDPTCGQTNCKVAPSSNCSAVIPLNPSKPGILPITIPISSKGTPYYNQYLGERVFVFNPTMNQTGMQRQIYDIFNQQGGFNEQCDNIGQYSDYNYALLFMPGTYPPLDIPIGYYTQVLGLGKDKSKVRIDAGSGNVINNSNITNSQQYQKNIGGPNIHSSSADFNVGTLNNFWRSCENMTVFNLSDYITQYKQVMVWAASQAVSLRNVKVEGGNIWLFDITSNSGPGSFASGGFVANCDCDGYINNGAQQQFIIRNSNATGYLKPNWNQVLVGCIDNDSDNTSKAIECCINGLQDDNDNTPINFPLVTIIDKTPVILEKPYLALDGGNNFVLMMPNGLVQNSQGVNKQDNFTEANFTIISASLEPDNNDRSNEIQSALAIGHVVLTPGSYTISNSIDLKGNLLIGLGLPRLKATGNTTIINGNGMISGIIFMAGKNMTNKANNNILVNLTKGSPSYLWDVYCRCGGNLTSSDTTQWSAQAMIQVNGDNSILDNVWCWVADHNADNTFSTWFNASCNYGVIVGGNSVTCYGLFAEHNKINNLLWTGDNGSVYMFQSEFNYFPPDCDTFKDAISYYVDDAVTRHSVYGAGAYCYFPLKQIYALAGFYFNRSLQLTFQSIFTVYLNGYGGIKNVYIDDKRTGFGKPVINLKTTDKVKTIKSCICSSDSNYKDTFCACGPCNISDNNNSPVSSTCEKGRCKPVDGCTSDEIDAFNNKPCGSPGYQFIDPPNCGAKPIRDQTYTCRYW